MSTDIDLSYDLITKYDFRVPRYTSYPTVPHWKGEFSPQDYINEIKALSGKNEPLSLYIHIPFCVRRCLFCACNVLITQREDRPKRYLDYLKKEIEKTLVHLDGRNEVIQLHLGGGTPTHLTPEQLGDLFTHINEHFNFVSNAEKSIEVHPSVTSMEHLDTLAEYGFNRLSMGVQDFDQNVQEKLNRFQTFDETKEIIDRARRLGFGGINIDLIYGLPYQTQHGFESTMQQSLELRPDRVALYSYAHLPDIILHQKSIPLEVIPEGVNKFELFLMARKLFLDNGYDQIGFDHFGLPTDEISQSYANGTLRRNFMGFTTKSGTDMVAFGYSAISELQTCYSQNSKDMGEYETMIEKYGTATIKGLKLSEEDILRKQVIMDWLCQNKIDYTQIEQKYPSRAQDIINLADSIFKKFEEIDFVERNSTGWNATPTGLLFGRVIASSFDEYYDTSSQIFSRSI